MPSTTVGLKVCTQAFPFSSQDTETIQLRGNDDLGTDGILWQ